MFIAALDKLCQLLVDRKNQGVFDISDLTKKQRKLEIQIEALDTFLRYTGGSDAGAGVVAEIVRLYYKVGCDSVAVGQELGLKPPHVRQVLWRLYQTALKMDDVPEFREWHREYGDARLARGLDFQSPIGDGFLYRGRPVTVLGNSGTLSKIRNKKMRSCGLYRKRSNT